MRSTSSAAFTAITVLLGAALLPVTVSAQGPTTFPNLIAAGDVDDDSAVLWAKVDNPGFVFFVVSRNPGFGWPARLAVDFVADVREPAKVHVSGLQAGTRYFYRAWKGLQASAPGTFLTAAPAGSNHGLRFGASGDWRGELSPYPAVTNADSRLDFFVGLGDTIYADYPSPAVPLPQATTLHQFRAKNAEVYSERFGLNSLGNLRRATSVFTTIDDHEVTNDFAGGAHPATDPRFLPSNAPFINQTTLFNNGLRAFVDYNPMRDERWAATGDPRFDGRRRLYRNRRYGNDAATFVLDARSFRDAGLAPVANPLDPLQVGAFLAASFSPARTMLGQPQIARLQQDLLQAQQAGVTWKFVFVPEPIQNLGVIGASDRFEGYAAERTALLHFIQSNGIDNVVFVAADLHGTLVNNLTYQMGPGQPQIATGAFEVITGSVAFDAPLGPTLVEIAGQIGALSPAQVAFYNTLPLAGRDAFVANLIDGVIAPLGYDPIGLQNSPIAASLSVGGWVAAHTFGWTEFAIDAASQSLTITTWGIDPYTEQQLLADPASVLARTPQVVQQFVVQPQ